MPFANHHSCRLRDPGDFKKGSFVTAERKHDGKRYNVIQGRLKGETTLTDQAFRYPKETWSKSEARSHCDDHDGILFEPASDEKGHESPLERRFITAEEFRLEDDEKHITGYAAKFDRWSEWLGFFKEKIRRGCFKKTIEEHDIRCLFNHSSNLVLGRNRADTLELEEDEIGLRYRDELPDTSYANDLRISIQRGDVTQCSFGFNTLQDKWSDDYKERELIEAKLYDVGPVTFPAYPDTEVYVRALCRDVDIDYDGLSMAIVKATRGIELSDEDRACMRSIVDLLQGYLPDMVEEPPAEGHSDDEAKPAYATLLRMREVSLKIRDTIGDL